ncbi:transcription antitermination factor [Bacillus amyloliquefaciens]|nr:transcription antitermination factor [Bacillus amyloliquefaciens]
MLKKRIHRLCAYFLFYTSFLNAGREGLQSPDRMEKNWYVVHTYSGYENKVKANLEKRVESMGMQDKIFRVVVPEEEETDIKNGKKKVVKKKVFPGYVLVEIVMTDDSWYVVRNTPGVTGFVGSAGSGSKPTPLLPGEAEAILKRMGMDERKTDIDFELNETVKVIDGPFANFTGSIEEIDYDKSKVKVFVNMFGRETPVELEFTQIDKL